MVLTRGQTGGDATLTPASLPVDDELDDTRTSDNAAAQIDTVTKDSGQAQAASQQLAEIMAGISMLQQTVNQLNQKNQQNQQEICELRAAVTAKNVSQAPRPRHQPMSYELTPPSGLPLSSNAQPAIPRHQPMSYEVTPPAGLQPNMPPTHVSNFMHNADTMDNTTPLSSNAQPAISPLLSTQTNAMTSLNAEHIVKLFDLPPFDGRPEEWPLFFANFNDTTIEFGYSNRQNLMRLQKALRGAARTTVSSLLIYPDNVPHAIEELQFTYGRPDLLVRSQLDKIQELPDIVESRLEEVLTLSNRVRNIVALFTSAKC